MPLQVKLQPVQVEVTWADSAQEVPPYDWTQGLSPLDDIGDFLEGDLDSRTPLFDPGSLRFPRLVRALLQGEKRGLEDEVNQNRRKPPKGSSSVSSQAIAALQRVRRAVEKDPDPTKPSSPTRQAVERAVREVGLLTAFAPNWVSIGGGLVPFFDVYDDSLFSWVVAAYIVHGFKRVIEMHFKEKVPTSQIPSILRIELHLKEGDYVPLSFTERARLLGFRHTVRHSEQLINMGIESYRTHLGEEIAQRSIVERRISLWNKGFGIPSCLRTEESHRSEESREVFRPYKIEYVAYLSILDLALIGIASAEVRFCRYCGGAMTGKRSDALFCNDQCRVYHHREKKRNPSQVIPRKDLGNNELDG